VKSKLIRYLVGIVILIPILLHTVDWNNFEIRAVRELEYKLYDVRLRATAPEGIDPRVVIIDIDDKSLAEQGQWPWNRALLAELVTTLFEEYKIEVLGLDMVFSEPDEDETLLALQSTFSGQDLSDNAALKDIVEQPSRDQIFSQTLKKYNVVMGYVFGKGTQPPSTGLLPPPLFDQESGIAEQSLAPKAKRYSGNLSILQHGQPAGFFSLFDDLDSDGIIRSVSLLNQYQSEIYPALSLSVTKEFMGTDIQPVLVDVEKDGAYAALEAFKFGFLDITLDRRTNIHVPYRGHKNGFRYISATDILNKLVSNPDDLAGTTALLGTSAPGLVDLRATPIHAALPGVEIHANLVAGLQDGGFKKHPGWATGVELIFAAVFGLLLIFVLPSLSAFSMTLFALAVIVGYSILNVFLWNNKDLIVDFTPVLVPAFLIYLMNLIAGYLLETRTRQQLKSTFGLYVPPEIIDNMQGQSVENLLKSDKKTMTVLFTDVRGFTTISEQLSPETLSELMNRFLTPMTEIVHRHGGAVDKYMGDAMMAFWGAPLDNAEHAQAAVQASVEMQLAMIGLNEEFVSKGWPRIDIGIGINTGQMNVGNMGSAFRVAYTVLGDAVNLGSRLEGLTKQYGVPILVSEATADACHTIVMSEVDQVRVKGKTIPIKIFTPIGKEGEVSSGRMHHRDQFIRALACYRQRNWSGALELLTELYEDQSKTLYQIYITRTNHFIDHPPPDDWDGVFDFEQK